MRLSPSCFAILIATLSVLALGCTVGPSYQPVDPPLPEDFTSRSSVPTDETSEPSPLDFEVVDAELAWWRSMGDPVLSQLVERAVRSNLDLEVGLARVREARAALRAAGGRLLPSVGASVSGGRSRASANGPGPLAGLAEAGLADLENELFTVGFDAAWELDLFGRVRRAQEASEARLESSEESYRALVLAVAAETAGAYIDLRGAERRIALAEHNLELQDQSLEVIVGKVETGLLPAIDRERARAQRAITLAALSPLRSARAAAELRLSVLLGEAPGSLEDELAAESRTGDTARSVSGLPEPPAAVAAGLPADLVWRRPDLRSAERALHAATADVGAAIGDRLPRFVLGGSRGFEAGSLDDLLESASRIWTIGPRVELPVFQGGQLAAAVEAARARLTAADARWRQSVLLALEEVEASIVAYQEARLARSALGEAARASERATELAAVLYDEGLRDYLVLLDAQRNQTVSDDALARSETDVARRAVALYKALGGGWRTLEGLALALDESAQSAQ